MLSIDNIFYLADSLDAAQRIRMEGSTLVAVQITETKAREIADVLRHVAVAVGTRSQLSNPKLGE
jgi:hypothetical protein